MISRRPVGSSSSGVGVPSPVSPSAVSVVSGIGVSLGSGVAVSSTVCSGMTSVSPAKIRSLSKLLASFQLFHRYFKPVANNKKRIPRLDDVSGNGRYSRRRDGYCCRHGFSWRDALDCGICGVWSASRRVLGDRNKGGCWGQRGQPRWVVPGCRQRPLPNPQRLQKRKSLTAS